MAKVKFTVRKFNGDDCYSWAVFRKDDRLLAQTIERLRGYLTLADFGTCAPHWPLMDEWDRELAEGRLPVGQPQPAAPLR